MLLRINLTSVFVAALAAFLVGMVWYSPLLFAKPWMALSGMSPEDCKARQKKGMAPLMIAAFAMCLLMAFAFGYVVTRTNSGSLVDAMRKAALLWGGFVVPVLAAGVLWEKKPLALFFINAGHYLVTLLVISAIIVTFP